MHPEANDFLARTLQPYHHKPVRVVEFGSRDVNGTPRGLFFEANYWGIDIEDGPAVDEVANAAFWSPREDMPPFDVCICAEVFEHTNEWPLIVASAYTALRDGGLFVVTCATEPRLPHSAGDGHNLEPDEDEYYENVDPEDLYIALEESGFSVDQLIKHPRGDLYAKAWKP